MPLQREHVRHYRAVVGRRNDELQKLYEMVRTEVKAIVDEADPEGLLALGSPSDEYDDAVTELTRRVLKGEVLREEPIERWFADQYGSTPSPTGALVARLQAIQASALDIE